jgi:hypothetical protein
MAGREGLKLARVLEKDTYKLEAHHRHLKFTHALENGWFPKSLRFNPPGNNVIFKQIMERASKHCMKARIYICHSQINSIKKRMHHTRIELTSILPIDTFKNLNEFLKQHAQSVRDTINTRHAKKHSNLNNEYNKETNATKRNTSVINLSKKPLTDAERSLLEKGPKFAITPAKITHKNIIAEVETAIKDLPDETKDIIRTNTASILDRACIPQHKNINERKVLKDLKQDTTRIIMKADKGNSLVIMDQDEYDRKMENLLKDEATYAVIPKPPFK